MHWHFSTTPVACCCSHNKGGTPHAASHPPAAPLPHSLTLQVLVWDLSSHISTSLAAAKGGRDSTPGVGTKLKPLHTLLGHSATIEDVCWCPGSSAELASVGELEGGSSRLWTHATV